MADDLKRLIQIVEAKLASLPEFGSPKDNYEQYRVATNRYYAAAREALESLAEYGGRPKWGGELSGLTLGGIKSTSTGGEAGAMRNWLAAARKRLASQEAGQ